MVGTSAQVALLEWLAERVNAVSVTVVAPVDVPAHRTSVPVGASAGAPWH